MPIYKYTAATKDGKVVNGDFDALDKRQFYEMLRKNDYTPLKMSEGAGSVDIKSISIMNKINTKDLAVFCRQFYTMLAAGVTIIRILSIISSQSENKKIAKLSSELFEHLQKGSTFSEALKYRRDVFPEIMINLVEAGEVSGSLDKIMERLAVHFEKENKINSKVKAAMIYPIVLSILAVGVVIILLTFVMPTFIGMFSSSGVTLPGPTRALMAISNFIRNYWYVLILIIVLVLYLFMKMKKTEKGKRYFDSLRLSLPVFKGLNTKLVTSRFTRTLSTLLSSGIPLLQSMEIITRVVGNSIVSDAINIAKEDIRKGSEISVSIKKVGYFPPLVSSMINIGEESGTLDEILDKTANYYDEELDFAIQKVVSLLEPLMIVVMAGIIGFIVISIALPMFDMMQTVN